MGVLKYMKQGRSIQKNILKEKEEEVRNPSGPPALNTALTSNDIVLVSEEIEHILPHQQIQSLLYIVLIHSTRWQWRFLSLMMHHVFELSEKYIIKWWKHSLIAPKPNDRVRKYIMNRKIGYQCFIRE